ncbi:MAG TPA: rRNA adenine N-6-methyltransferase family protein, partial [Thermoleophilaceae bacterium]|nr:rRNA adenine N-6-methyltransferase family protein [Thermoleophilaceae bacterium]
PRSAFSPAPNVDSTIVVLRRRGPTPSRFVRDFVRAAFAHRRKTLAGSLALARPDEGRLRARVRAALIALGHPPDARAERLSPDDLERLALELCHEDERPAP